MAASILLFITDDNKSKAEKAAFSYEHKSFTMLWAPGPAWVPGKTVRNQPYWAQHAAFMDRLFENGAVVLGGPFADATGSLVIVEAENEHEVADLFASDPFVVHAIFVLSSLKQWLLFLDSRREG